MKKFLVIILIVLTLMIPAVSVFAMPTALQGRYADALFIDCQTTQLGRCTIIIGMEYEGRLSLSGSTPVNISFATINGRVFYGTNLNTERTLRLPTFATMEYIPATSGSVYAALTVTQIYDTNIDFWTQDNPIGKKDRVIVLQYVEIFLHAAALISFFFWRKK